jgi:tRNA A37 threonylcarbamoyladenosine modification protein TsaB
MIPLSSILLDTDDSLVMKEKNKKMIKDFLIIDCTGKNDSIALKIDNKFFIKKLQTNLIKNEILTLEIVNFIKKYNVELNSNFSIFVNSGPGSFSGVRISLAVAKGIQIVKKINIYSYNNFLLYAAPYLIEKKEIVSIQKTNNFYYYCNGTFEVNYHFTFPKKINLNKDERKETLFIVPDEIKNDDIIKNINPRKIRIAEFNLKNIDLLIKDKLVKNKLIKPLYLS